NLGANGNYRKALTFVRHELAVVMGADDVMLKNYIETVVAAHEQFPSAQIIQPGVEVIDEHNQHATGLVDRMKRVYAPRVQGRTGRRLLSGEPLAVSLIRGNWLYFPSVCWRSDALVAMSFREGLNVVQDLALALDLIKAGGCLVVDNTVCFQYRRHRQSDSSWRALEGTRFIEEREFFTGMAAEFDAIGWRRAARTARLHLSSRLNAATLLPRAWRSKQHEGVRNLREHVLARPGNPKNE
ncbi:MAG TPA: glycosyltransferase family 2 protein, partial [Dermatophilaceae bacterium]|nr:glycosyltransferase family 2 protein [Dermatophilaceae bacterium]